MKIEIKNRAAEPLPVQPQMIHRALRQPELAPKVVTFGIHRLQKRTGTVSETVSENSKMIVENSGGLKRINLYFTGVFAILLELNRTLQVPSGRKKFSPVPLTPALSQKEM